MKIIAVDSAQEAAELIKIIPNSYVDQCEWCNGIGRQIGWAIAACRGCKGEGFVVKIKTE